MSYHRQLFNKNQLFYCKRMMKGDELKICRRVHIKSHVYPSIGTYRHRSENLQSKFYFTEMTSETTF
jgi:hypothetical protein